MTHCHTVEQIQYNISVISFWHSIWWYRNVCLSLTLKLLFLIHLFLTFCESDFLLYLVIKYFSSSEKHIWPGLFCFYSLSHIFHWMPWFLLIFFLNVWIWLSIFLLLCNHIFVLSLQSTALVLTALIEGPLHNIMFSLQWSSNGELQYTCDLSLWGLQDMECTMHGVSKTCRLVLYQH